MATTMTPQEVKELISIYEFEAAAKAKLPKMIYDFYAGGAYDEFTLRENRQAYDHIRLRYKILQGVGQRDLSTTILGHKISMPIIVPPVAFQKMVHPEGEAATAKAVHKAGTLMTLSTLSNTTIEDVVKSAQGSPVFFQLYIYKDREASKALVHRAEAAGVKALVLTVDAPVWGRREKDVHNQFTLPKGLELKNLTSQMKELPPAAQASGSGLDAYVTSYFDSNLTWKDIDWLQSITKLPLIVKGVARGDDAVRAVDHGVAAIVVSNHGGRQLDTSSATIEALEEVVEAVNGAVEVIVDGGVRRGTDVLKALALGAKAVQIGRPIIWGLANGGADGAANVLELLKKEFDLAMALAGCKKVDEIKRDLVRTMNHWVQ